MSVIPVISEHIEATPEVCGGMPRIAGHRIRVQDVVVWHEQMKMSPSEIVSTYPTITLADVYSALAYYHDHSAEIDKQMTDEVAFVDDLRATTPSKLRQIYAERTAQRKPNHDGGDSLSSG